MLPELVRNSPENVARGLNFTETELTLGLPGDSRPKAGAKRVFSDTVELTLGGSSRANESKDKSCNKDEVDDEVVSETAPKSPKAKNQVVGWPPVRPFRQNMIMKPKKFVKVAVDGAPYLRKVDLETYNAYQHLLFALGEMFTCFTVCDSRLIDPANGTEYVPTYEDKDGDWMLVGDVPWKMFVESCKRVRLMKRSEANGLAPKSPLSSSSRS